MHRICRRQFLVRSASTIAASATMFDLSGRHQARGDRTSRRFGGLPMGIQSYSLRKFDLPQVFRHVQGLELQFVEFSGTHLSTTASEQEIEDLKKSLETFGITFSAHGVNGFGADHAANRQVFEFARRAGIRNITANPQPNSFDSLDELVAEFGIRICIHNHGPGALYDGLKTVTDAVSGHHPLVGACIDTGHVLRSGEDPIQWIRELGPRVFALHVKDVAEMRERTHDVVIGRGHLDVVGMFRTLKAIRFPADGALSLEYESNPDNPIDDIRQCLAVADEAIAKVNG